MADWMAYYEIEPFGEERADLRAGIIASAVGNFCGRPKTAFSPDEFMPLLKRKRTTDDGKALSRNLRAAFKQIAGKKRKKETK